MNFRLFVSVLSEVLSLDKLSFPQEKDREKEKVGNRPARLNEKKGDRELERETKTKEDIFCWKKNIKI